MRIIFLVLLLALSAHAQCTWSSSVSDYPVAFNSPEIYGTDSDPLIGFGGMSSDPTGNIGPQAVVSPSGAIAIEFTRCYSTLPTTVGDGLGNLFTAKFDATWTPFIYPDDSGTGRPDPSQPLNSHLFTTESSSTNPTQLMMTSRVAADISHLTPGNYVVGYNVSGIISDISTGDPIPNHSIQTNNVWSVVEVAAVPEPSGFLMLSFVTLCIAAWRRYQ